MSGIYIPGIEMPKECWKCRFEVCGYCMASDRVDNRTRFVDDALKKAWCPLGSVPPHGRLIDADRLRESIRRQTGILKLMGGDLSDLAEILEKGFLQEIDNAPTIIPREES